jgi:hypothetical protein
MKQCEILYLSRFVFNPLHATILKKMFLYIFYYVAYFKLQMRVWSAVQDELKASRDDRARLIFVKISDNRCQEAEKQT